LEIYFALSDADIGMAYGLYGAILKMKHNIEGSIISSYKGMKLDQTIRWMYEETRQIMKAREIDADAIVAEWEEKINEPYRKELEPPKEPFSFTQYFASAIGFLAGAFGMGYFSYKQHSTYQRKKLMMERFKAELMRLTNGFYTDEWSIRGDKLMIELNNPILQRENFSIKKNILCIAIMKALESLYGSQYVRKEGNCLSVSLPPQDKINLLQPNYQSRLEKIDRVREALNETLYHQSAEYKAKLNKDKFERLYKTAEEIEKKVNGFEYYLEEKRRDIEGLSATVADYEMRRQEMRGDFAKNKKELFDQWVKDYRQSIKIYKEFEQAIKKEMESAQSELLSIKKQKQPEGDINKVEGKLKSLEGFSADLKKRVDNSIEPLKNLCDKISKMGDKLEKEKINYIAAERARLEAIEKRREEERRLREEASRREEEQRRLKLDRKEARAKMKEEKKKLAEGKGKKPMPHDCDDLPSSSPQSIRMRAAAPAFIPRGYSSVTLVETLFSTSQPEMPEGEEVRQNLNMSPSRR